MKGLIKQISAGAMIMLVSGSILAAENGLSGRISEWEATLQSVGGFLYAAAFLVGMFLAVSGLINIKKYADNPQQNPLTKPLIYFVAGAFLMGLTAWNTMISETVIDGDSTKSKLESYEN
jgi:hypothetical protein